jgi:phosphonate transport system substrate-binding protein
MFSSRTLNKILGSRLYLIVFSVLLIGIFSFYMISNQAQDTSLAYSNGNSIDTLSIGLIPSEQTSTISSEANELSSFLTEELGLPSETYMATSYESIIEGVHSGSIQVAFMDAGPAWIAYNRGSADVVFAEVHKGETNYTAAVFVQKGSKLSDLPDLIGTRIAFTSLTGSSGFILPIGSMIEQGLITPESNDLVGVESALKKAFKQHTFAGGYGTALTLLATDKVDVATGSVRFFNERADSNIKSNVKIMKEIGKVPNHVIVLSNSLDESSKLEIIEAFFKLNEPDNAHILDNLYGVSSIVPTNAVDHIGDFGYALDNLSAIAEKKWNIAP